MTTADDVFKVKMTIPPDADFVDPPAPAVLVRLKMGLGHEREVVGISWPREWARPAVGHSLIVGGREALITSVTFDLDGNRTILDCE